MNKKGNVGGNESTAVREKAELSKELETRSDGCGPSNPYVLNTTNNSVL